MDRVLTSGQFWYPHCDVSSKKKVLKGCMTGAAVQLVGESVSSIANLASRILSPLSHGSHILIVRDFLYLLVSRKLLLKVGSISESFSIGSDRASGDSKILGFL